MILRYVATAADEGKKVYMVLRRELMVSDGLVRRLKQAGTIFVNGDSVYTDRRLLPGETLTANITAAEPPCDLVPEAGDLEILYENEGLLAVNKPSGVITHPSRSRYTGTLANFVAGYLEKTAGDGHCHAVNRLDRDTSGVVLFAKSSYMKARAAGALGEPDAEKAYATIICGRMEEVAGTINQPIRRLEEKNMRRIVSPDGQRAVTHYETLASIDVQGHCVSLLRIRLETGRTHQIRVHFHHAGHPVLGDILYYSEESRTVSEALGIPTQALHAQKLTFTEPLSGQRLTLTAAPPPVFDLFTHTR